MSKCEVEGCEKEAKCRGFCGTHYALFRRNGKPERVIGHNGPMRQFPEEYASWDAMKRRCRNGSKKCYREKKIKICHRWLGADGFANFLSDMGPKPSYERTPGGMPRYTIDRIDSNSDYKPSNCRWADWHTQSSNRDISNPVVGVCKATRYNAYVASYQHNGKRKTKTFPTYEEAVAQRKAWEQKSPFD